MKVFGCLVLFLSLALGQEELYVQVKNGVLRGRTMRTRNGREVSGFTGIPFARPPIGDLRFKSPEPSDDWTGVKDATQVHAVCPQRNIYTRSDVIEGDEDCLFLNVYKPKEISKRLLPVMVFFHGGGWLCCSGNTMYYGPDMLLDKDIILVIPNYRLGAFGFLTTGDEVVPGNNGLKDQVLALKWVQENIVKFGGDPNNVNIFGESAGGASAHFHMLSPLSKGLFHSAISQSGTALCTWAVAPNDLGIRNSKKLAELVGCPSNDNKKMVDCLRNVDSFKIIEQDRKFMEWDTDPMIPFKPVVEPNHPGAFMSKEPIDIIKSGRVNVVPWIVGLNKDDGALRATAYFGEPHLLKDFDKDFNRIVPISLEFDHADNPGEVAKKIRKYYFGDKSLDNSTRQGIVNLYTDGWFLHGSDKAIYLHTKYLNQRIYYYLFEHRGVTSYSKAFGDKDHDYGVCHADELLYLFPVTDTMFPDEHPDAKDKRVTKLLTRLWTSFAKNGHPTSNENSVEVKWAPVTSGNEMEYLSIKSDCDVTMQKGLLMDRAKFWRSLPIDHGFTNIIKDEL